ncbi:MAG: ABC transporter permease [Candidatus Cloacimonetes bacterium]|nr:ABC transporter permease [Candidatus Cloacimonadota bacterium]MDD4806238.1 ABC transporter permease [Candidatus Cloacimonadota bacterium]
MIWKHILMAFRQIGRQRFSFGIAILGLAISLAAFGHLLSYSRYYLDYDKNAENHREWYRLRYSEVHPEMGEHASASFFIPPARMLLRDIPEVKDHIVYWPSVIALNLICEGRSFQMQERVFVSAAFPKHYKMEIIYGNPDSLLADRNGILISESFSRNFFGDVNPVGTKVYVGENPRYFISGVFKELDPNLHLRHDHYSLWFQDDEDNGSSEDDWYLRGHVRVRIPDKEDVKIVQSKLNEMLEQHRAIIGHKGQLQAYLDPISKIHFLTGLKDDAPTMSITSVYTILLLSFMLLLSALVNFLIIIGLSWKKRADEFHFRRAVGAGRKELWYQLFCEHSTYFALSLLLGVAIYLSGLGLFSSLIQIDVSRYSLLTFPIAFSTLFTLLGLAIVSGMIMSYRYSGVSLEQDVWHSIHRNRGITVLLFAQMFISFAFITLAISMALHYSFIRNIDWGWDNKNTIQYKYLTINDEGRQNYYDGRLLRTRIREIPGVTKESVSNFSMISQSLDDQNGFHEVQIYLADGNLETPVSSYLSSTMPDFFETREIKVVSGSIPEEASASQVVVNQSFADKYLPNPLGSRLRMAGDEDETNWYEVVAVVEDAWFFPTYHEMIPLITILKPYVIKYYQISWQEGRKQEVLPALSALFADAAGSGVFGYSASELELAQAEFYAQDKAHKDISLFMAMFVAFIAVMGIYAASSASIHTQMKDISIRKVCGAELSDIIRLYAKKYCYLYIGSGLVGMYLANNLIRLYNSRYASVPAASLLAYPVAAIVMALIVFIPLCLNIIKAFKADANQYLQAD